MDIKTWIGVIGAACILIAFVLEQLLIWKNEELRYDALNLFGGTLLVIYALLLGSYPFAVLNGVWALVSLRDVIKDLRRKKPMRQ